MMQRVLDPRNFYQVLAEIKNSKDKLFDFSGTSFQAFNPQQLNEFFTALSTLPHSFTLRLNNCKFDENSDNHIATLALGFATTHTIQVLEFKRSISSECSLEILLALAQSLVRNHALTGIILDGFKVTPVEVVDVLKSHPTAKNIFIDGLLKTTHQVYHASFFKPAANQPISSDFSNKPDSENIPKRKNAGG